MADFKVDWEAKTVICPQGNPSHLWKEATSQNGTPVIHVDFHQRYCKPCSSRSLCTKAKTEPREITLRTKEQHD